MHRLECMKGASCGARIAGRHRQTGVLIFTGQSRLLLSASVAISLDVFNISILCNYGSFQDSPLSPPYLIRLLSDSPQTLFSTIAFDWQKHPSFKGNLHSLLNSACMDLCG